jgi:hypothetical protein
LLRWLCVCVFSLFPPLLSPHHTSHLFSRCNMGPFAQNASDLSFPPLTFSLDLLPWDWRTGEKPTITTTPHPPPTI